MRARLSLTLGVIVLAVVAAATVTLGQPANWYPSRWGAADQRGAANRITPRKVLEAKNLITTGTVYQLGRVYETAMPMFGTRHYSLRIPQTFGPLGSNQTIYHDEIVSAEIGQVGTQFDGLGHIGVGDLFYNGNNRHEFSKADGLTKLGVENVGAIATRGVLVDVAGLQGRRAARGRLRDHARAISRAPSSAQKRGDSRGRRRARAHGLGIALADGQREVRRERAGHRPRGGAAISSSERS